MWLRSRLVDNNNRGLGKISTYLILIYFTIDNSPIYMLVIYCPKRKQDSKKKKSNRAFEKFFKSSIAKKKILEGLAVIVDKIKAPRRFQNSQVCSIALLPHDALQRSMLASSLALECFYRHVLSRMSHYEYATVSILLAFRDYREAHAYARGGASSTLCPNFSSPVNRLSFEMEPYLLFLNLSKERASIQVHEYKI